MSAHVLNKDGHLILSGTVQRGVEVPKIKALRMSLIKNVYSRHIAKLNCISHIIYFRNKDANYSNHTSDTCRSVPSLWKMWSERASHMFINCACLTHAYDLCVPHTCL
jgi:hypothetical protein